MKTLIAGSAAALLLSACAALPPPRTVLSTAESVAARGEGRADAPSLWAGGGVRLPEGLTRSGFLAVSQQGGGLSILDLNGHTLQRMAGPRLGELDIAAMPMESAYAVLIGGVYRTGRETRVIFHRADHGRSDAALWGEVRTDLTEPSGFCMRQVDNVVQAVVFDRRGEVRVLQISEADDGGVQAVERRRFRLPRPAPGCAIDTVSTYAHFSDARGGFMRTRLSGETPPEYMAPPPAPHRLPRSLGVSYLTSGAVSHLVSLDEDRAAFSVWRLERNTLHWLGRFEVREPDRRRAVRSIGGIEAYGGPVGSFEGGLVVVQDQTNEGAPNLKFVRWPDVRTALGF